MLPNVSTTLPAAKECVARVAGVRVTDVDGHNRYRQIWCLTVRDGEGLALPLSLFL